MGVPGLWEIIRSFKQECGSQGWRTSESEDWVRSNHQYHNFLWTRTIHPSTFKKIASASKCAVREGISYQVVDVAYTAWLFSDSLPDELWRMITENQVLADKTAVYDLSCLHSDKPTCEKMNSTRSEVFKEFENFLRKKFDVKFRAPEDMVPAEI